MDAEAHLKRLVKAMDVPVGVLENYVDYDKATEELSQALTEARRHILKVERPALIAYDPDAKMVLGVVS